MAFEVTATRKRPPSFKELVGQDFVVSTLESSVREGRIAHAYLFAGPRGVGKTSAARILAKALNCEHGPTDSPCGTCSNCTEISTGSSLDVIEIDGASNTSVNDVREIKDEVLFAPNSSRYKVYIIDEVHMLSNNAFNALLKTIEEPPPYIVFVFATTEIHKVPATIRSRCQQFIFHLIPVDVIIRQLTAVCEESGVAAEQDALFWIAKEATGSLRDAYTLLDQIISFSEGAITMDLIKRKLGLVGIDRMNTLAELLAARKADEVFALADEILMQGVAIDQFIIDLAEYFRNLLFIKAGITKETLLGFTLESFSQSVVEQFSASQLERAVGLLFDLYRTIRYSLNPRFELELCLSKLSVLADYLETGELLQKVESLRESVLSAPVPAGSSTKQYEERETVLESAQQPEQPPSAPREASQGKAATAETVTPSELDQTHVEALINGLKSDHLALSSTIAKATSWSRNGESITVAFADNYSASFVRKDVKVLTEKMRQILKSPVTIDITVKKNQSESKTPESESDANTQTGLPQADNSGKDDTVDVVKKIFRGEVIQEGNE